MGQEGMSNPSAIQERYKQYPDTKPEGFKPQHESTIGPIAYEIPFGSKVLDVGCNSGELMELLKDKRDCEVFGIDPSALAVEKAVARGLDAKVGVAESLPYEDASFDVIVCAETLSHIEDVATALKEIRRVLKKDGFFLGCVPHKNTQSYVWEDARQLKRNYDEAGLRDDLERVFDQVHVRTLKGAQFALVWSHTFMGNQDAEMLFKAGGAATSPWESDQIANAALRVWFGFTQLAGTIYYRMIGYADKLDKLKLAQAAYERGPLKLVDEKAQHWQKELAVKVNCGTHCPAGFHIGNRIVMNHLEQILRVAHVSVWQIVTNRYVLSFLRCAKDLANGKWYQATGEKKKFITEVDDYMFDIPSGNIASHPYHPNSELEWVASEQIKLSDAIICSTQFLKDKLEMIFADKKVYLIPNTIDFDIWDKIINRSAEKKPGIIRIGYTGCSNHRKDLEIVREPLSAILKEYPNVDFVMTPQPGPEGLFTGWKDVPNIGVISKWAPIDEYPAFLGTWGVDIGIAPLRDNNFNRAKSNLRWLEYSALRIPTIASPVYPFKHSIEDGITGYLCNSSQEWYDAFSTLIEDEIRRRKMAECAYVKVRCDYNMEKVARKYAHVLEEVRNAEK